jgi:HEAT repeat protein
MKPLLLFALPSLLAAQPRVINGRVETHPAGGRFESEFRRLLASQTSPAWIGWSVPMIAGDRQMCSGPPARPVKLEGPDTLVLLFRADQAKVEKIRTLSQECELDAGGLPFRWLSGVESGESVRLLESFATAAERRSAEAAIAAIALHRDPAADTSLERLVAPAQPEAVREKTAFWLGNARGRRGYQILRRMLAEDSSSRVREKVIFALTQSKEPEAVPTIIQAARNDKDPRVRGQALFWLAQKAGKQAVSSITEAISSDPSTEVKRKAVFALSQLPKDEGVPLLIQVARSNHNPEVRRQAMFWLGQSADDRALRFFEEVLAK